MPKGIYNGPEEVSCSNVIDNSGFIPMKHQTELLEYFLTQLRYKGMLAFFKLGSGKTCASILISDSMLALSLIKKVFVLTPGSLRSNWIQEYCKSCGKSKEFLESKYTFITTNYAVGNDLPDFNDSIVIIDEAHILMNGVYNKASTPLNIYNKLRKSNCKILALTGTPIFSATIEWFLLGHLIKPTIYTEVIPFIENTDPLEDTMLQESMNGYFKNYFIEDTEGNMKPWNETKVKRDMYGIISFFAGTKDDKLYPTVQHMNPIRIRMSKQQEELYLIEADKEEKLRKGRISPLTASANKQTKEEHERKSIMKIMANKYIISRSISNFFYPEQVRKITVPDIPYKNRDVRYYYNKNKENPQYVIEKIKLIPEKYKYTKKSSEYAKKNIAVRIENEPTGWIDKENFRNGMMAKVYSRKFMAVLSNIAIHTRSKHVVFSFFKTKGGVQLLSSLLNMCGVSNSIYSGDVSSKNKQDILDKFNSFENRYGGVIKVLLITEAGAQGISILEAGHLHVLESTAKENMIQQAIGRVVRYKSHMVDGRPPMPPSMRNVKIWRYWSTLEKLKGVDEVLYEKGIEAMKKNNYIIQYIQKSSIAPKYNTVEEIEDLPVFTEEPELNTTMNNFYNLKFETPTDLKYGTYKLLLPEEIEEVGDDDVLDE